MLSQSLETFLLNISAGIVTEWFIYLIVVIFILAIVFTLAGKFVRFTQYATSLMTSLGILGTFIGIVIGLLGFDTHNIDGSIPTLLEGLKTAFITSICGLVGAILFNCIDTVLLQNFGNKKVEAIEESITPQDIHSVMRSQEDILGEMKEIIEKTYFGISGNEEGSLVGQFKMLRADLSGIPQQTTILNDILSKFTEFSDQQISTQKEFESKLFSALTDFADMLSKSATEQIIEALKTVIEDFNKNLTEQFGENFKALDESVKKLVTWQVQYKEQVEQMGEQYQQSVTSLVATKDAVAGIWTECENIPVAMDNLRVVLETNQHQIEELHRHLEAFVTMRDAAVDAVPTIQGQLDHVGEQLSSASDNMKERLLEVSDKLLDGSSQMRVALEEGSQHFRDSVTVTQQSFNELADVVKGSSEDLSTTLKDTSEELSQYSRVTVSEMKDATIAMQNEIKESVGNLREKTESVGNEMGKVVTEFQTVCQKIVKESFDKSTELAKNLNEHLERSRSSHEKHLQDSIQKTGETINTELESLEKATAREIQKAMQEMGDSLVKITSRFVDDYENMVKAMDQVVNHNRR